jgi:hypothetical protein
MLRTIRITLALVACVVVLHPDARARQTGRNAQPIDPIAGILDAFSSSPVVALDEGDHGNEQGHAFRLSLLRSPNFPKVVNDIVMEMGNSRYQWEMDRFISGEDVPLPALRKVWHDMTTPDTTADVPIYEEFVRAVRSVNTSLQPEMRVRVLLGDPPTDWERVQTPDDLDGWIDMRETFSASLIRREVIAKKRKALVIFGGMHLQRKQLYANYESTGLAETLLSRLESIAGMRVFNVWTNTRADLVKLQPSLASWRVPSLALLKGTTLGAADFTFYAPAPPARISVINGTFFPVPKDQWRSMQMEDQFDALLYLGSPSNITYARLSRELCRDQAYVAMRTSRMRFLPPPEVERFKKECGL